MWTPKRADLKNGIYEYELHNGLTLLLLPRPGLHITTSQITYRVGSRNEGLTQTGDTHLLEHAMFKGSKKFQGKDGMWKIEEMGAYMNANTWLDRTSYFSVIDTKNLKDVIDREADRMLEPLLTGMDTEMVVVRNEYERGENNPFQVLDKRMMATAFMAHPYGHSTIGWKSDIEGVSTEQLRAFHDKYYTTDNATYTFVGNFDPHVVMDQVAAAFGDQKRGKGLDDMFTVEPVQMGQRRVEERRPTNACMMGIGFKAPHGLHRDAIVLKVVAKLLTSGPKAFTNHMKKAGVVHDVMAQWERTRDPYLFTLWATTNYAGKEKLLEAERVLTELLMNFPSVNDQHLSEVKNEIKFAWKNEMEGTRGLSSAITEAISRGNPFDSYDRFSILEGVTIEDVERVAKLYFDIDKSTVAMYYPGETRPNNITSVNYQHREYDVAPSVLPAPESSKLAFKNADLHHGLANFQYPTTKVFAAVTVQDPTSDYTAKEYVTRKLLSSLMMRGVNLNKTPFDEAKIVSFLDNTGASRSISSTQSGITLRLSIPADDQSKVNKIFRLMKAEIESPSLKRGTFEYLQQKTTAELGGAGGDINMLAKVTLFQKLFIKGDPNYRHSGASLQSACKSIRYGDIVREHTKLQSGLLKFSMVANSDAIRTPSLKTTPKVMIYKNMFNSSSELETRVNVTGKTSCTVMMGMVVPTTSSYDLITAVGALGNGFSGRLMQEVRDKMGLTYGVGTKIVKLQGTSMFVLQATFAPSLLEKGLKATRAILDSWFTGDLTKEEISIQKQMLIGGYDVHFDRGEAVLEAVHNVSLQGHKMNSLDNYKNTVKSVTLEGAISAVRGLKQSDLKTVVVGTFK
jgi:zinc protease